VAVVPAFLIIEGHEIVMLEIRVIMNSSIEDVLSFKCCNLHDQNFEIHLKNLGQNPITVPSSCELIGEQGRVRLEALYPGGTYTIPPGEMTACYCTLAEDVYDRYQSIAFIDTEGREHLAPLRASAAEKGS
jgi:hypothetical protein